MHTYMHTYIHRRWGTFSHKAHAYIHTYIYTCIHAYKGDGGRFHTKHIHTCIHAYIHTQEMGDIFTQSTRTYIHTYIHTYVHIQETGGVFKCYFYFTKAYEKYETLCKSTKQDANTKIHELGPAPMDT